MITYEKLWETMKEKGVSQYDLVNNHHISKSLIHRLRKNEGINLNTLNNLCNILDCNIEDIVTYHKDE